MNAKSLEQFDAALARAAAKAGIDVSQVTHTAVCTDRTWGDRCGRVFYGASPEINERAARFFHTWISKHAGSGSYEAQRSISWHGIMSYTRYNNGAAGWHSGPLGVPAEPSWLSNGFLLERVEAHEGYAVNTTYYPGSD